MSNIVKIEKLVLESIRKNRPKKPSSVKPKEIAPGEEAETLITKKDYKSAFKIIVKEEKELLERLQFLREKKESILSKI